MQEYNPELIGYALEDSLTSQSASQLSVAEIGAMSKDLPFMAKYLINKIKKDARIDVKKHWKVRNNNNYHYKSLYPITR